MDDRVNDYIEQLNNWKEETKYLRSILLNCGVKEEYKWKQPCYTYKDANILILSAFKDYCALNFFKGALLGDPENILVMAGKNSQSARQLRFTTVEDIKRKKAIIASYVQEAIQVEESGIQVRYKKVSEYDTPDELQEKFRSNPALEEAFFKLTPGRQKAYLLHFSGAKQSKTRIARINRYTQRILANKGLNDCVCGLSKRPPSCDGSHKTITDFKDEDFL